MAVIALYQTIATLASEKGVKPTEYFPIIRFAVSGQAGGADLFPMLEVLGKERVLARISKALQVL
jgi:glutamyl/glutaminyl-tRNA synthetase